MLPLTPLHRANNLFLRGDRQHFQVWEDLASHSPSVIYRPTLKHYNFKEDMVYNIPPSDPVVLFKRNYFQPKSVNSLIASKRFILKKKGGGALTLNNAAAGEKLNVRLSHK